MCLHKGNINAGIDHITKTKDPAMNVNLPSLNTISRSEGNDHSSFTEDVWVVV